MSVETDRMDSGGERWLHERINKLEILQMSLVTRLDELELNVINQMKEMTLASKAMMRQREPE